MITDDGDELWSDDGDGGNPVETGDPGSSVDDPPPFDTSDMRQTGPDTWIDENGDIYDSTGKLIAVDLGDPEEAGINQADNPDQVGFDEYGNPTWSIGKDSAGNQVYESVGSDGVYHTYVDAAGNVIGYSDEFFNSFPPGTLGSTITAANTANPRNTFTSGGSGGGSGGGTSGGSSGGSSDALAKAVQQALQSLLAKGNTSNTSAAAAAAARRGLAAAGASTSPTSSGATTLVLAGAALVALTVFSKRANPARRRRC